MNHQHPAGQEGFWRSKSAIAVCVFLGIAGVLFVLEHRAHALEWLPYLVVLACPLIHFFMHGNHGGHSQQVSDGGSADGEPPRRRDQPGR